MIYISAQQSHTEVLSACTTWNTHGWSLCFTSTMTRTRGWCVSGSWLEGFSAKSLSDHGKMHLFIWNINEGGVRLRDELFPECELENQISVFNHKWDFIHLSQYNLSIMLF